MDCLIQKTTWLKNRKILLTRRWEDKVLYFSNGTNLKVNVIEQLESEFTYFVVVIQHVKHYAVGTSFNLVCSSRVNICKMLRNWTASIGHFSSPVGCTDRIHCLHCAEDPPPHNACSRYEIKPSECKLQPWRLEKCGILLHCHCSQGYSDLEW